MMEEAAKEELKKKRRGGRPKLEGREKRENRVKLRFADAEYAEILAEMENANFKEPAVYLREKLVTRKEYLVYNPRESLNVLNALWREIAAVGKNINQLARYANYLKINGQLRPDVLERHSEQMGELTELELKMQAVMRRFFRQGLEKVRGMKTNKPSEES